MKKAYIIACMGGALLLVSCTENGQEAMEKAKELNKSVPASPLTEQAKEAGKTAAEKAAPAIEKAKEAAKGAAVEVKKEAAAVVEKVKEVVPAPAPAPAPAPKPVPVRCRTGWRAAIWSTPRGWISGRCTNCPP